MAESHEEFRCPLTLEIFNDPVVAMDGYIYERSAIIEWFKTKTDSPMTRVPIQRTLIECFFVRNALNSFLEAHPEFRYEQFKQTFADNVSKISKLINDGNFKSLMNYSDYSIKYLMDNYFLKKLLDNQFFDDMIVP